MSDGKPLAHQTITMTIAEFDELRAYVREAFIVHGSPEDSATLDLLTKIDRRNAEERAARRRRSA